MFNEGSGEQSEFSKRLTWIEALESELLRKASPLISEGVPIFVTDLFVLGGIKRALTLASGFRQLMESRNFTCAASLLRMQIDTAARLYALSYVGDMDLFVMKLLAGERFDRLKDASGMRLRDAYLVGKLAQSYPWVANVYAETSDFVHLSGRHFFTSVSNTDDAEWTLHIEISAADPKREDSAYFEV